MTTDQMKYDHVVYEEMLSTLNQLGHRFGRMTCKTLDGDFTIGLTIEEWLAPKPLEDYIAYLKDILPATMKVDHFRNKSIVLTNTSFYAHQMEQYQKRLSEEQRTEGKAFLRKTLHGLKQAI